LKNDETLSIILENIKPGVEISKDNLNRNIALPELAMSGR
jgi:hypothetical protein